MDGLAIKKAVIGSVGYFNEVLCIQEDSEYILRLASACTLLPGRLDEAVAMRRVHKGYRISAHKIPQQIYKDRLTIAVASINWLKKHGYKRNKTIMLEQTIRLRIYS